MRAARAWVLCRENCGPLVSDLPHQKHQHRASKRQEHAVCESPERCCKLSNETPELDIDFAKFGMIPDERVNPFDLRMLKLNDEAERGSQKDNEGGCRQ